VDGTSAALAIPQHAGGSDDHRHTLVLVNAEHTASLAVQVEAEQLRRDRSGPLQRRSVRLRRIEQQRDEACLLKSARHIVCVQPRQTFTMPLHSHRRSEIARALADKARVAAAAGYWRQAAQLYKDAVLVLSGALDRTRVEWDQSRRGGSVSCGSEAALDDAETQALADMRTTPRRR
jgi:hypothetical protein